MRGGWRGWGLGERTAGSFRAFRAFASDTEGWLGVRWDRWWERHVF
jgi:hypothetical protein